MMPAVECRDLEVAYGTNNVLHGLNLSVAPGEVVALLGPSGSGKSTLLSAIAGFVEPRAGEVLLSGNVVADARRSAPPEARDVAVVFQQGALWPHLSALETVAYPLRRRGINAPVARHEAAALLVSMGLEGLADRRPAELSGGEQQRVGLARALARGAGTYLFDEPTSHVDGPLRAALLEEVATRRAEDGAAALYATHDSSEALAIADRVALLRRGAIVQVAPPAAIYAEPVDVWAARLTGPAAVLNVPGRVHGRGEVAVRIGSCELVVPGGCAPTCSDGRGALLVRADWAELDGPLRGLVQQVWYRGPHTDYRLCTDAGPVEVRQAGTPAAAAGETVGWSLRRAWLVPAPHGGPLRASTRL